jgi:hypothetical protein
MEGEWMHWYVLALAFFCLSSPVQAEPLAGNWVYQHPSMGKIILEVKVSRDGSCHHVYYAFFTRSEQPAIMNNANWCWQAAWSFCPTHAQIRVYGGTAMISRRRTDLYLLLRFDSGEEWRFQRD